MVNFLFIEYIYIFLVLLFNNKKNSQILFFKNENKKKIILNYMKGYYNKFISFSFSFLLLSNIGMEINNHSNLTFLTSSKC